MRIINTTVGRKTSLFDKADKLYLWLSKSCVLGETFYQENRAY